MSGVSFILKLSRAASLCAKFAPYARIFEKSKRGPRDFLTQFTVWDHPKVPKIKGINPESGVVALSWWLNGYAQIEHWRDSAEASVGVLDMLTDRTDQQTPH